MLVAALAGLFLSVIHAEPPVELPPILKTGPSVSPADLLTQDPVSSLEGGRTEAATGSSAGTLQKNLNEALAVPISGSGTPGNAVQLRGLGRSAEETDVQALGVPLNPPQGGGFDLSIFPAFLWSDFVYQRGPALGTFDPRGTSGSLSLVPWSASALAGSTSAKQARGRATQSFSMAGVTQLSVAGTDGAHVAAVAGNSSGDARGPSGAFSARAPIGGRGLVSFHLLATDLDAKIPGTASFPTPQAHQETVRVIPVAQLDWRADERVLVRTSLFYDWGSVRYEDLAPGALPATFDRIVQYGAQSAMVAGSWKAGVSAREIRYHSPRFSEELGEEVASAQVSRAWELGAWLFEPTVRVVGVSRTGLLPEASLGVRWEFTPGASFFARAGLSRKFPSLVNRYYSYPGFPGYPGFQGNPALAAERDWTITAGFEAGGGEWSGSLLLYTQWAESAQVRAPLNATTDTLVNQGSARIVSLSPSVVWRPVRWWQSRASVTFSSSRISASGLDYPGLAPWLGVFTVGVPEWKGLDLNTTVRASSGSVAEASGNRVPAYQEWSAELGWRPWPVVRVSARVDNLLNQPIELVLGYPSRGRTASLMAQAEF